MQATAKENIPYESMLPSVDFQRAGRVEAFCVGKAQS